MGKNQTLYGQAIKVTEEYLGPAGERFLRRQIENHLQIKPEDLQKENLPKLIDWTTVAFALLTSNKNDVESFSKDLESLIKNGK